MGVIEDVYADLDADVSEAEFREAVEAKVEQMGGLADEETAAMLVAHELGGGEINGVADIEPGMEEAKFVAKVVSVGDLRTFERDGDDEAGTVVNVDVADETGRVRVSLWDELAEHAVEDLDVGQVLRIKGRPREGYNGVEVSADRVEPEEDVDVDVQVQDTYRAADLSLGLSDVDLQGRVLDTGSVRTFDRDDGTEGRVANLVLGDETGRVRVTLWDERADHAAEFDVGESVEVVDGYVRDRDGALELHVGDRGRVVAVDEEIDYRPETDDIETLEIGDTADIAGVVRSADPVRTFDRDDGSEGQVRNVRIQDATGDIRVALWGEKADIDLGPGDRVVFVDVQIQDGWQDDIEASANWRSSVLPLDETPSDAGDAADAGADDAATGAQAGGLAAFAGEGSADAASAGSDDETDADGTVGADSGTETGSEPAPGADAVGAEGEHVEFTGTVVQAGDPVILDNGEETMSVETTADVTLGQEVTARGTLRDGHIDAEDVL